MMGQTKEVINAKKQGSVHWGHIIATTATRSYDPSNHPTANQNQTHQDEQTTHSSDNDNKSREMRKWSALHAGRKATNEEILLEVEVVVVEDERMEGPVFNVVAADRGGVVTLPAPLSPLMMQDWLAVELHILW